jgi:hypothetical protein
MYGRDMNTICLFIDERKDLNSTEIVCRHKRIDGSKKNSRRVEYIDYYLFYHCSAI